MIWLGIFLILAMAALGAPLFAVLMGAAMLGFYSADIDLAIIAIELYRIVDTPLLVALPLFTFSGYLLSESNTSTRLVNLMQSLFGWLPSGLAVVDSLARARIEKGVSRTATCSPQSETWSTWKRHKCVMAHCLSHRCSHA